MRGLFKTIKIYKLNIILLYFIIISYNHYSVLDSLFELEFIMECYDVSLFKL